MNDGLIARRYANALLIFAREEQEEVRVYEDAQTLIDALPSKESISACVEGLSATMQKFLTLVIRNKRAEYLPAILRAYRKLYRQENGITRAWLTTAREDPELAGRLAGLMKAQGFTKVDFKTDVDPALIGGFIVQVEDKRLDASIASQLKDIRKELEAKIRKTRKNG
ncbi:MAG: ATP synthase F1 subunit delta [Bacteroidales bacterium]|nr:ATP synthase F1 subunit delta [Bacteroidales bacterium]